jgi:hypothetical protein
MKYTSNFENIFSFFLLTLLAIFICLLLFTESIFLNERIEYFLPIYSILIVFLLYWFSFKHIYKVEISENEIKKIYAFKSIVEIFYTKEIEYINISKPTGGSTNFTYYFKSNIDTRKLSFVCVEYTDLKKIHLYYISHGVKFVYFPSGFKDVLNPS